MSRGSAIGRSSGVAGTNRLSGTYQIRAVRMGDGVLFLVRDVSALRAFEAEVERVTAIVQNTDDAIVGADTEGLVTHWNPGAERLLGYAAEEMLGHADRAARAGRGPRAAQAARFASCSRAPGGPYRDALGAQGPRRSST